MPDDILNEFTNMNPGFYTGNRDTAEEAQMLVQQLTGGGLSVDRGEIFMPSLPAIQSAISSQQRQGPAIDPPVPGFPTVSNTLQQLQTSQSAEGDGRAGFVASKQRESDRFARFKTGVSSEEAMRENIALLGDRVSEIDLNDPYVVHKLQQRGLVKIAGPENFINNFTSPNKDNWITKIGKAFLGPAAGTILGAATFGAAAPLLAGIGGGVVSGATGSAVGQAIQGGGLDAINAGQVAKGAAVGGLSGGLSNYTAGIENPLLRAGVQGVGNAGISSLVSGEFDVGDFANQALIGVGTRIAGNAIGGGIEGYKSGEGVLKGALRGSILGGRPAEFVNYDEKDFNDLDAEAFGPLSSHTNLAGFEGYNPSEELSVSNASIDDLGGPYANIEHDSYSADPIRSPFENQTPIGDPVENVTGVSASGLSTNMNQFFSPGDSSYQADWDAINEDINADIESSDTGIGEPPQSFIGDGKLVGAIGDDLLGAILGSIGPDQTDSNSSRTIDSGLLESIMSIGAGKKDPLSDLQIRGTGR